MNEQTLDLRRAWAAVRRRRVMVGLLGVFGILAGIAYGLIEPALPSAVALVLLPPSAITSAGTPVRDSATEIAIATSAPVLGQAGESVSPPLGAGQLRPDVKVTAVSQDVLSIRVKASRGGNAIRLANAIASDYIHYVTTTGTGLNTLNTEAAQLTHQLKTLQTEVNQVSARLTAEGTTSAAGQADSALLGQLNSEVANASQQLSNVNSQIVVGDLNGQVSASATRILQRASEATRVSELRLPLFGLIGLGGGLLLGAVGAISEGQRDRRLRRRDDLVAALGVPVLASVHAQRCRTVEEWLSVLEHYQPSVVDVWALRRLLRQLAPADGEPYSDIRIVSFSDDTAGLAIGPQLATFAASRGAPTMLMPHDDPAVVPLRAACRAPNRPDRPAQLRTVWSRQLDQTTADVELAISVRAVSRARPELDDSGPTMTILAVSAGLATVDDLAKVALAAVDSGRPIEGIVVANPDPDDRTTGGITELAALRRSPTPRGSATKTRTSLTTGRAGSSSKWMS